MKRLMSFVFFFALKGAVWLGAGFQSGTAQFSSATYIILFLGLLNSTKSVLNIFMEFFFHFKRIPFY